MYIKESPYDHEVTRKVKRAMTSIDKFRCACFPLSVF